MSRHRDVRTVDVDEEFDGYYSCYGHSVEDEFCISPRTAEQFLYNRAEKPSVAAFLDLKETVPEEDEESFEEQCISEVDSSAHHLSPLDEAKLQSCIEAMQDVVGDAISEEILRKAAIEYGFNLEQSLNAVLQDKAPKPQRNISLQSDSQKNEKIKPCLQEVEHIKNSSMQKEEMSNEITANSNEKAESEAECRLTPRSKKSYDDGLKMYLKERGDQKPLINLVVVGHVDAGKSTLMGHLLYKLGQVTKRSMHKFEQDSKKLGKSSFAFAWVLDETPEERNRGITMDVAESSFETKDRSVMLLDAPGHKDFIPNMISGASQADAALLVIDATRGEFETGFEAGGQTREHALLIRSLGVSQLAVVINKLDNVSWSQERFKEIKKKTLSFLKAIGFKENDIVFVPCSGLSGENLSSAPETDELKNWYSGPTLVDVIGKFQPPERLVSKPLRICIDDVFKGITGGFCVSGKIEGGYVKAGEKVLVLPAGEVGIVKGITIEENSVSTAFAGDKVIIQLNGVDNNNILAGSMICDPDRPVKMTNLFEARIVIFCAPIPITKGFPVILHYKSMAEQAIIKKLVSQLHKSTGEVIKKRPRCLNEGMSAVVEIEVTRLICLELFQDFKDLGRFTLRYSNTTIAAGVVILLK